MTRTARFQLLLIVSATVLLWTAAVSSEGDAAAVMRFALAGTLSGLGLVWIGRAFASVPFTWRAAWLSSVMGLLILTPLIGPLLDDSSDPSNASALVLAFAAAGAAAMGGSVWGIMRLATDAFDEWRGNRKSHSQNFGLRQAHQ